MHSSDTNVASVRGPETGIRIDEAWVSVGEVEFELAAECDRDLEVEFTLPPRAVDLASVAPEVEPLDLPGDDYCRVEFSLAPPQLPLPVGAPAELQGHTIVLIGSTEDGTPFELVSAAEFELEVRPGGGFIVPGDALRRFVLSFDAATWLGGAGLESGSTAADGVIHVSDAQNEAILDAFEERLEGSADLVNDRNGNAVLDAGETLD